MIFFSFFFFCKTVKLKIFFTIVDGSSENVSLMSQIPAFFAGKIKYFFLNCLSTNDDHLGSPYPLFHPHVPPPCHGFIKSFGHEGRVGVAPPKGMNFRKSSKVYVAHFLPLNRTF